MGYPNIYYTVFEPYRLSPTEDMTPFLLLSVLNHQYIKQQFILYDIKPAMEVLLIMFPLIVPKNISRAP